MDNENKGGESNILNSGKEKGRGRKSGVVKREDSSRD